MTFLCTCVIICSLTELVSRIDIMRTPTIAVLLAATLLAACGSKGDPACRVGADCASGLCHSDGTCAASSADASNSADGASPRFDGGADGQPAGHDADAGLAAGDGGVGADAGFGDVAKADVNGDAALASCVPNHDGIVARSEAGVVPGLHASYAVAKNVDVALTPKKGPDGLPLWSWVGPYPGDHVAEVTTEDVSKGWYAKYFPGATYAVSLGETSGLLGVFELTDTALLLRGAVSPQDGLFATRIVYDPPLPTLQFPLQAGQTWKADATASGLYQGVISAWSEHLDMQVVQAGNAQTPLGNFPVLQLRGKSDKVMGILTTTYRTEAFVAECFGAVAKVDSKMNESNVEFTAAAEIRRLAP